MINRPQPGRLLKYFIRLGPIGFAYCRERSGVSDPDYQFRRLLLRLEICGTPGSALQRKHCAAAI
jgi:hypothetical protein